MRRLSPTVAAILATFAAGAQDIPFVPGQGTSEQLTEPEREVARLAIDALAADLQIAKEGILVDTIRAVDWPDSSYGCPKPGRAYLTVITPGHKITLRVNGRIYVVHEAKRSAFICHKTEAYAGVTPQLELVFGQQMLEAQQDLANRLGVLKSEIKPVSGVQETWDDASLGCPQAGVTYLGGKVTGWVLTLRHGTRDYTYHTDMSRTIPCPAISTE